MKIGILYTDFMATKSKKKATSQPQPVVNKREAEKTLFSWRARARPFKRREKEFTIKMGLFAPRVLVRGRESISWSNSLMVWELK